jgi:hypothetical protein
MRIHLLKRLWRDESAVVNTTDLILLTTLLGIGLIVGIVMLRNQVVQEYGDLSVAVGALDQGYSYPAKTVTIGANTYTAAGSTYVDNSDIGDGPDLPNDEPAGINVAVPPGGVNKPGEAP